MGWRENSMARWSKQKAESDIKLPPLTTDHGSAGADWHSINKIETAEEKAQWTVNWDTSPHADTSNTSCHKSEQEAIASARRFLRLGFIVYSITDPAGIEKMDEPAINEQLGPPSPPKTSPRF
jgi:hypothetical protein